MTLKKRPDVWGHYRDFLPTVPGSLYAGEPIAEEHAHVEGQLRLPIHFWTRVSGRLCEDIAA